MKSLYDLSNSINPEDWQNLSEKDFETIEKELDSLSSKSNPKSILRAVGLLVLLLGILDLFFNLVGGFNSKLFDGSNYSLWILLGGGVFIYFKETDEGSYADKLRKKIKEKEFAMDTFNLNERSKAYLRKIAKRKFRQIDEDILSMLKKRGRA